MQHKERIGLVVFFLIAFGVPWVGWTTFKSEDVQIWLFPPFVSIAGFVAAYAEGGKVGLVEFSNRTLHLSGAKKYVLLAATIPLTLGLCYLLINGVSASDLNPAYIPGFATMMATAFVTGPLAEEFGWRGYLQNKLLSHMRPLFVSFVIGTIWWAWHFPLFYSTVFSSLHSALGFLAFTLTWSVFLVYLVSRSGGSVWPAVFLHWAVNTHASVLGRLFPSLNGELLPGGSNSTLLYAAAAGLLVVLAWRFFLRRYTPQATSNNSFKPNPLRSSKTPSGFLGGSA
jgi:membrane protease YdiL (CAAX protease family)